MIPSVGEPYKKQQKWVFNMPFHNFDQFIGFDEGIYNSTAVWLNSKNYSSFIWYMDLDFIQYYINADNNIQF